MIRMTDDEGLSGQIARLEERTEALAAIAERCDKIMLLARIVAALGIAALLALLFGFLRGDPLVLIAALTAAIGGTVTYGTNASTARQARAGIEAAETLRRDLIGRIGLRLVSDRAGE